MYSSHFVFSLSSIFYEILTLTYSFFSHGIFLEGTCDGYCDGPAQIPFQEWRTIASVAASATWRTALKCQLSMGTDESEQSCLKQGHTAIPGQPTGGIVSKLPHSNGRQLWKDIPTWDFPEVSTKTASQPSF